LRNRSWIVNTVRSDYKATNPKQRLALCELMAELDPVFLDTELA